MPIDFQLIVKDGAVTNRAVTSWARGEGGGFTTSFDVKHRLNQGTFTEFNTNALNFVYEGVPPGTTFEVQVRAVGVGFPPKKSRYVKATSIAPDLPRSISSDPEAGITQLVPNVSSLILKPIDDKQAVLSWVAPVSEKLNNLTAIVRHSTKTDGTGTFANSVKLVEASVLSNAVNVPLLSGEYIVKLKDQTTRRLSDTAVSVVTSIPEALDNSPVLSIREDHGDLPFSSGSYMRGVLYSDLYGGLVLDGDALWDEEVQGNIDDLTEVDFIGTRKFRGEYEFSTILDLGGKFAVTLDRILANEGLYPGTTIDERTELIDSWTDIDDVDENGNLIYQAEDTSATLYFRGSNDELRDDEIMLEQSNDPLTDNLLLEDGSALLQESSVVFGAWSPLDRNTFVGRVFQFKAELETDHVDQTPVVTELGLNVSMPPRVENGALRASGAAADPVTFANAFYEAPTIGITAFNLQSGDYYELTSVTRTGFTVHFKDSTNSSVDRNYQYVAAGYGSEQP